MKLDTLETLQAIVSTLKPKYPHLTFKVSPTKHFFKVEIFHPEKTNYLAIGFKPYHERDKAVVLWISVDPAGRTESKYIRSLFSPDEWEGLIEQIIKTNEFD